MLVENIRLALAIAQFGQERPLRNSPVNGRSVELGTFGKMINKYVGDRDDSDVRQLQESHAEEFDSYVVCGASHLRDRVSLAAWCE